MAQHHPTQFERPPSTVNELVDVYIEWARGYYLKPGTRRPTREAENCNCAMRGLREVAGDDSIESLSAETLFTYQQWCIEADYSRRYINGSVNRIRRIVKWSIRPPRRWLSATVLADMQTIEPLRFGRTAARDTDRVRPAPQELIDGCLNQVRRQIAAMIRLQLLTGMRPGEAVLMRPCDIERQDGPTWIYRPSEHKTEHHGHERIVLLGPKSRRIIRPFMQRNPSAYLFSPRESMQEFRDQLTQARITPLSCGNRRGTNRKTDPQWSPNDCFTTQTYRQAIHRGCNSAFPPPAPLGRRSVETNAEWARRLTPSQRAELKAWRIAHRFAPNQLRHNRATELRRAYGIDVCATILGHASPDTSLIYAERDLDRAMQITAESG